MVTGSLRNKRFGGVSTPEILDPWVMGGDARKSQLAY